MLLLTLDFMLALSFPRSCHILYDKLRMCVELCGCECLKISMTFALSWKYPALSMPKGCLMNVSLYILRNSHQANSEGDGSQGTGYHSWVPDG